MEPRAAVKKLGQILVTNAYTTVYEVPAYPPNAQAKINTLWICNKSAGARTFSIKHGLELYEAQAIAANTTVVQTASAAEGVIVMAAGTKLEAKADLGAVIVVTAYGAEWTA